MNLNNRIVFRRIFEWGHENSSVENIKYVAYYETDDDNSPIENAKIVASDSFTKWAAANIVGEYGFKLIDFSVFYVWFFDKTDASKFLEEYY